MRLKFGIGKALAFVVCVFCTIAFGVSLAKADIDSGFGGNNAMDVSVGQGGPDITGANIVIYRVASAKRNEAADYYDYVFDVDAFKDLGATYAGAATNDSWQKMTDEAWAIATSTDVEAIVAPAGDTITGLSDGIYLVWMTDVNTGSDTYRFVPALVVLPGKVDASGNPVYNTSMGRWTNTDPIVPVKVVLKSEISGRFGSLQINKTVNDFAGEAATFVYHIVDTETGGEKYENYAAVQYTSQGVKSAVVNHIPAGMEPTATEIYTGARYQLVSEESVPATIVADAVVGVDFVNEPSNSGKQGHGIENHFVYDDDTDDDGDTKDGDWVLTPRLIDASEVITEHQDTK